MPVRHRRCLPNEVTRSAAKEPRAQRYPGDVVFSAIARKSSRHSARNSV
jgi:hypothetical protein